MPLSIKFTIAILTYNIVANLAIPVAPSNQVQNKGANSSKKIEDIFYDKPVNVSNVTFVPKDLIVIRTFVYEIGVLTNTDPNINDEELPVLKDEIDIRTFQPPKNNITVDWWKSYDTNDTKINSSNVAFTRIVPVGVSILPKENLDASFDGSEEETDEDNDIIML